VQKGVFSEVGLLGGSQTDLCIYAIPKIQNYLSSVFTLCWEMVHERCASSGEQGKHSVEGEYSKTKL
jgi:hypothetical protein